MSYKTFKLKPWHFIVATMIFYIITVIISEFRIKQMPVASGKTSLIELDEIKFENDDIHFVFFYDRNSQLCGKMRYNIEKLIENDQELINFYAIDVNKNPSFFFWTQRIRNSQYIGF